MYVNHKYDIWNCGSWPKIKWLGRFGLKIAMCLIFMKSGNQNKSNMLIMNITIGIDSLNRKLKFMKSGPKTEMCFNFYEIWHLEQIEHSDYEYITWSWLSWPKIIDSGKFGPKIEMFAMFMNFDTQNLLNILIFVSAIRRSRDIKYHCVCRPLFGKV